MTEERTVIVSSEADQLSYEVECELGVTAVMDKVTTVQEEEEESFTNYMTPDNGVNVTLSSVSVHDSLMIEQTWGNILMGDGDSHHNGSFGVIDPSFDEVWAVDLGLVARVAHVLPGEASGETSGATSDENLASNPGRGCSGLQETYSEASVLSADGDRRRLNIFTTDDDKVVLCYS